MITLEEATTIEAPIERCFDLSRSIEVHLEGTALTGERTRGGMAVGALTTGLIGLGQQVTWSAVHFGIRQTLTSRITRCAGQTTSRAVWLRECSASWSTSISSAPCLLSAQK